MIAAAAAAMIGGAQAVVCVNSECGDVVAGTAYKVAISLKTTDTKSTRKASVCGDGYCTSWRVQATKKINGLIWEVLDACSGCYAFGESAQAAFWANCALDAEFAIGIGLIGNTVKSKKIEAYGGLNGEDFGALSWAGFGTMASSVKKYACSDDECLMYPKSITGGIAGYLVPGVWACNPCGDDEDACDSIQYEGCCCDLLLENTAAYGTIKITYDAATAKKVALAGDGAPVASFYKIPSAAAATIDDFTHEIIIEE